MKSSLIPYRVLSLLFLLLFCTGNVLAKECRNYSFLNKGGNKLDQFVTVDELKEGENLKDSTTELETDAVVVKLTNLAIWVDSKKVKWKDKIDEKDPLQREALA